jgi:large subunit ribosomal protein L17
MRHRVKAGVLGRSSSHRQAMYRNLVTSLLEHERIETTDSKAKGVRQLAERMITLGKRGDLHARRRALRVIRSRDVAAKVFDDLAERFRDRPGGYTRIVKSRYRVGDAAAMSIIELVEGPSETQPPADEKPAKKRRATAKKAALEKTAKKKPDDEPKKKAASKKKTTSKKKTASKKQSAKSEATSKSKAAKKKTTNKKK